MLECVGFLSESAVWWRFFVCLIFGIFKVNGWMLCLGKKNVYLFVCSGKQSFEGSHLLKVLSCEIGVLGINNFP